MVTFQVNPVGPVAGLDSWFAESFNSESRLTSPGYVYDALGRNTFIPAADSPTRNAAISLAYNLVDQVTGITQTGSTTSFTYDALGRRVNETADGLTTVRHYGDSSDNPEWTTQLSGANLTTDVYASSLGSGLAVTTTFKGKVSTASMQLTNLRGHVVTTLDLDSNSVGGWCVYDSFGNPQTSQTNDNLINYSSYGQQERATNTTGLILMGARVYNPETNQFTSKDPIKGGNENSYTYPNDPVNSSDTWGLAALGPGLMKVIQLALNGLGFGLGLALCSLIAFFCVGGTVVVAMMLNVVYQAIDIGYGPRSDTKNTMIRSEDVIVSGLLALSMKNISTAITPWLKSTFGIFASAFSAAITWVIKKVIEPVIQFVVSMYFPKNHQTERSGSRKEQVHGRGR